MKNGIQRASHRTLWIMVAAILTSATTSSVAFQPSNRAGLTELAQREPVVHRGDVPCGYSNSMQAPATGVAESASEGASESAALSSGYMRIVVRFNVVRRSDGTGGIDESVFPFLMRDLNYGFRHTPIRFVQMPEVGYIDNSTYYANVNITPTVTTILISIRTAGVLNFLITPTIQNGTTNALGPPSPRGAVIDYASTGTAEYLAIAPHEVGHVFSLLHPFETGLGVECTNGSNCVTAGDRICDTPASVGVHGGNTLATGEYYLNTNGPCPGDPPYDPDTRLYMEANWAFDDTLKDKFSPGELSNMLASLAGTQADLLGPMRPDIVIDCDDDGMDDMDAIMAGVVVDDNRDGEPDACQTFARPGDLVVACMTNAATNRPRVFDRLTGEHRVDLWNGIPFAHSLRIGPDGLIYMPTLNVIGRIDLKTGRTVDNFVDGYLDGAVTFVDVLFDSAGDLLALDNVTNNIRRYSGTTGAYLGEFATLVPIGMTGLKYMEFGPDGNIYVVASGANGSSVQRINAATGALMGAFVPAGSGGLGSGRGLLFHNGLMYVSDGLSNAVRRYDATTGAFVDTFVSPGSGGLINPHVLRFGPDGNLYVTSRGANSVKRYDGQTGAYLGDFVAQGAGGSPATGGLTQPAGLLFVPCDCPGDMNGDGAANGLDIAEWVDCLLGPTNACMCADMDGVVGVDANDLAPFATRLLSGDSCAEAIRGDGLR